jgi:hypothetical protein
MPCYHPSSFSRMRPTGPFVGNSAGGSPIPGRQARPVTYSRQPAKSSRFDCRQVPLAGVEGLEPPTPGFGDRCSSQLSYTPKQTTEYRGQTTDKVPLSTSVVCSPSSVVCYSMMLATTPAPTVRPPSRMAKRSFSSIAIGTISSTVIVTLSPGITISVPSGRCTTPVTSVVRK